MYYAVCQKGMHKLSRQGFNLRSRYLRMRRDRAAFNAHIWACIGLAHRTKDCHALIHCQILDFSCSCLLCRAPSSASDSGLPGSILGQLPIE